VILRETIDLHSNKLGYIISFALGVEDYVTLFYFDYTWSFDI
jgi:hypothetical protein